MVQSPPSQFQVAVCDLKAGQSGRVIHIEGSTIASRLIAMGVLPGAQLTVVRKAPFGGGCYIKAGGIFIALRQSEAGSIFIGA